MGSPAWVKKRRGNYFREKKTCPTTVKIDADEEGRRITVTLQSTDNVHSKNITITNLYAPNIQQKQFYTSFTDWYLTYPITNHMIGGNFNLTVLALEDRKHIQQKPNTRLMRP